METKLYEFWYSVETWIIAVWIDSERPTCEYWQAVADETLKLTGEGSNRLEEAKVTLMDRLRDEICEAASAENRGLFAELLSHALTNVDWQEIAEHLLAGANLQEETAQVRWTRPRPGPEAEPRLSLGEVVTAEGASWTIDARNIREALARHQRGDWGDCCPEDWQANEEALRDGHRLHSVYRSWNGDIFWILTEPDRSVTTVLLPSEY
jgi:hypothetical protein